MAKKRTIVDTLLEIILRGHTGDIKKLCEEILKNEKVEKEFFDELAKVSSGKKVLIHDKAPELFKKRA